ncbi:MAG: 30S ribosome-binding factor RbfA [Phycisphaerales bacterium]|nr:30S ribosome-binding factor RbfA [Phycisphaerales bacterium]
MRRSSDHRSTGRHDAGGRAPGHRAAQVASLLQRIVQGEIQRGIADPRVRGLVTVLGVDLSQDLEDATVRVSVLPGELGPLTVQGLSHASAHFRRAVQEGARLRHIPRLRFELDESLKRLAAIDAAVRAATEKTADDEPNP